MTSQSILHLYLIKKTTAITCSPTVYKKCIGAFWPLLTWGKFHLCGKFCTTIHCLELLFWSWVLSHRIANYSTLKKHCCLSFLLSEANFPELMIPVVFSSSQIYWNLLLKKISEVINQLWAYFLFVLISFLSYSTIDTIVSVSQKGSMGWYDRHCQKNIWIQMSELASAAHSSQ